jgi:ABC-type transporter Mla maintaining outer membrane lipid asymmetry permease subunit MlaE
VLQYKKAQVSGRMLAFVIAMIILIFFILVWTGLAGKIVEYFLKKLPAEIFIRKE